MTEVQSTSVVGPGSSKSLHNQNLVIKTRGTEDLSSDEGADYEVSKIVGERSCSETGKILFYLVRWKGFTKEHDSWEPLENLDHCPEAVEKWKARKLMKAAKLNGRTSPSDASSEINPALKKKRGRPKGSKDNKPRAKKGEGARYNGSLKRSRSESSDEGPEITSKRYNSTTESLGLIQLRSPDPNDKTPDHPDRLKFLENLKKLKGPQITVVNTVDMVPCPPLEFIFVDDYVYQEGVPKPDPAFNWGCQKCKGAFGCQTTNIDDCDCGQMNHEGLPRLAYKHNGRLKHPAENCFAIHECNEMCACNHRCPNKVVLKGRQVPLEIFKTENKGWGLRCPVDLDAGEYIDRYIGEVITEKEAERRAKIQELRGLTYLFDLDKFVDEEEEEDDETQNSESGNDENGEATTKEVYCVDGADYGGITRFINHSCEPNVMIHVVTHNRSTLSIYDLALFTSRKIPAGEELTFEYVRNEWKPGDEIPEDKKKFPCYCGARKCRGWLF